MSGNTKLRKRKRSDLKLSYVDVNLRPSVLIFTPSLSKLS
jgi:hypothetical protein